jgi:hypothetical protein
MTKLFPIKYDGTAEGLRLAQQQAAMAALLADKKLQASRPKPPSPKIVTKGRLAALAAKHPTAKPVSHLRQP